MAININQKIPSDFNPINKKDFEIPTVKKDTTKEKIDICSINTYKDMLKGLSLPSIDFPKINLKMFDLPTLPTFDLPYINFKFNSIKFKGLSLPFKCNLSSLTKPDYSSLLYKKDFRKLGDINCKDKTGGTNSDLIKNKVATTIAKTDNCAKKDEEVISDTAKDLLNLSNIDTPDSRIVKSSIVSAMVDDKFDIGAASKLINNTATNKLVSEAIKLSPTNKSNLFKVSKNIFKEKYKEASLIYATTVASFEDLTKDKSDVIKLSKSASKDTTLSLNGIPSTKTLSVSQHLNLYSKIKKIGSKKLPFGMSA